MKKKQAKNPRLSIITACKNRAPLIEQAIQSVVAPIEVEIEHIIVDGGSVDGTLSLLEKYPNLQIISEPDQGVYEAINKGIMMSRGDIIGFLNSDDYFAPNILVDIIKNFNSHNIDVVNGSALIFTENNCVQKRINAIKNAGMISQILYSPPIINAWFFRRDYLLELYPFDCNYPYAADRELLIRACLKGIEIKSLDKVLYYYRRHDDSLTINDDRAKRLNLIDENMQICKKYIQCNRSDINNIFNKWFLYLSEEGIKTAIRLCNFRKSFNLWIEASKKDKLFSMFILRNIILGPKKLN